MKKKTNLQTPTEEGVKPRQHGPQKEKTQITVRIDKELMNAAYMRMKEDNTRITDILERGLVLALGELEHDLSRTARKVRFVLANATREQQVQIEGLAVAMVEPLLEKQVVMDGQKRIFVAHTTAETDKIYELVKWFLESRTRVPHAKICLDYYSRYGKTAEEIAKLASGTGF